MNKLSIPLTPENYSVWYEYSQGNNLELNQTIDNYLNDGVNFSKEINESLHTQYIAERPSNDLKKILKKVKVKEIIVGHTSQKKVKSYFDNKLFLVDSSIQGGEYGEILFIENGQFERGTPKGERLDFE